jgi:hypothetical protein
VAELAEGSRGVAEAAAQQATQRLRRSVAAAAESAGAKLPPEASDAISSGGGGGSPGSPTGEEASSAPAGAPQRHAQHQQGGGCPRTSPVGAGRQAGADPAQAGDHGAAAAGGSQAVGPDTERHAAQRRDRGHVESPKAAKLPRVESAAEYVLEHGIEVRPGSGPAQYGLSDPSPPVQLRTTYVTHVRLRSALIRCVQLCKTGQHCRS